MRKIILASLLALGACQNGQLTPQAAASLTMACKVDGAVQPIAVGVAATLPQPGAQAGATVDALLVHPAVVKACADLGGAPVAVATDVLSTVAASPVTASVVAHNPEAATVAAGAAAAVAAGVAAAVPAPAPVAPAAK
jgi:hypothetical protein